MKDPIQAFAVSLLLSCQGSEVPVSEQESRDDAVAVAQFTEEDKDTDEAAERVRQIRQAVEIEAAALGPDHWAGSYYYGDGLGVNEYVSIAPKAGFAFEWHGCLGLYDRNFGPLEFHGRELRLQFQFPNSREGFQGLHESFVPIRWGNRQYLVAVEEIVELCNAANQGETDPHLLLKESCDDPKVFGKPDIPEEYSAYLTDPPIQAAVTSVGEPEIVHRYEQQYYRDTPLTLDAGTTAGVLVGMEFTLLNSGVAIRATVTAVRQDSCEAIVRQDEEDTPPTASWKLWTGAHYTWDDEWVARNPGLHAMSPSD